MEDYLKRVLGVSAFGVLLFLVGITLSPGVWPFSYVYGFLIPFLGLGFLLSGIMTVLYAEHLVIKDGKRWRDYSQMKSPHPFLRLEEHLAEGHATQATETNKDTHAL